MNGLLYSKIEQTIRQNISKHLSNISKMSFLTFLAVQISMDNISIKKKPGIIIANAAGAY